MLNSVMELVAKKERRKREILAKVANVALEHKGTLWGTMNDSDMRLSKDLLVNGGRGAQPG